ncbi:MAG TPA: hypothetical protein VG710_16180 [Opitutus sp.]|nr:hypothetical protein [Opitutus sp.]
MVSPSLPTAEPASRFDWPLAYEAEHVLRRLIEGFLQRNGFARRLGERMRDETGTDFYEWVDHLVVAPEDAEELRAAGLVEADVPAPAGTIVLHHPAAMMPRALVRGGEASGRAGSPGRAASGGASIAAGSGDPALHSPSVLAIRPERLADFLSRQDVEARIEGDVGARLRRAVIARENGTQLEAVERLGYRGFVVDAPRPEMAGAVARARELFRARRRNFADDEEGVRHAFAILDHALALVPRDAACELFFAEERAFWEFRNRAARVQKRRQDALGLGWGNHDHHTFRCSRRFFAEAVQFFARLGLEKRERFYAGDEAGWGAQVMEAPAVGIVVFADVDLQPGEVDIDFAAHRLPELKELRTVGLWCALHGDSLLQAGMHHLEARFDFARLRDQLAQEGVTTMKPFSDFEFLKQAFTEGERWRVRPERIAVLGERGLITPAQAEAFRRDGAIGSHLENLQRRGGFKGFNQKAVSAIIAATDPRCQPEQTA